jgi:hypothetical protein
MWIYSDSDAQSMALSNQERIAKDASAKVEHLAKKLHDFICCFCEHRDEAGRCYKTNCKDNERFSPREV